MNATGEEVTWSKVTNADEGRVIRFVDVDDSISLFIVRRVSRVVSIMQHGEEEVPGIEDLLPEEAADTSVFHFVIVVVTLQSKDPNDGSDGFLNVISMGDDKVTGDWWHELPENEWEI